MPGNYQLRPEPPPPERPPPNELLELLELLLPEPPDELLELLSVTREIVSVVTATWSQPGRTHLRVTSRRPSREVVANTSTLLDSVSVRRRDCQHKQQRHDKSE